MDRAGDWKTINVASSAADVVRGTSQAEAAVAGTDAALPGSLFHEHWWLAAASNGRFREVTVSRGNRVVGRLPFVLSRRLGFIVCQMPPFTHVLGPVAAAGAGKPQTQLLQRLSIVRSLIEQLPRSDAFKCALDYSISDGLAFQEHGFHVSPQYSFEIDCRISLEDIWNGMHFKTRQHIRRAEEKFSIDRIENPHEFVKFYQCNLKKRRVKNDIDFTTFADVFSQSLSRCCGEILCARWPDGKITAMTYLVWGHGRMYYLLSARAGDPGDNGSVNLLIWSAIKRAHDLGLRLDLDGVSTVGTARFLSGFNGTVTLRMVIRRTGFAYAALQYAKRQIAGFPARETASFT